MVLAPVARDRKGEFSELFADMQSRGYVRFRIGSGGATPAVVEADALPALKKTEKHDIDVVIDRLRVRPDMKQRLAESFEAALRIADGRAIALRMDRRRGRPRPRTASTCSATALPARCAATRCRNWSRGCSPSTRRWAPARSATAWAR
jgi:excinuclease UvrABC ATPase subunit